MDELDASAIDAMLAMLKEHGVESFEGLGFSVKFGAAAYVEKDVPQAVSTPRKARTAWENESLWVGGEPPKFPKKAP